MLKRLAYWGSAILAGIPLGLGAPALLLQREGMGGDIASGPWHTSMVTGSSDADPWTRAQVARRGLLALAPEETLYYNATTDSEGKRLNGSCRYRMDGRDPGARWWSITAYGSDSFLIANPQKRYSFSQTTVARAADRSWSIVVSASEAEGNWLPVRAGENFELTVRFYNPETDVYSEPGAVALPKIMREGCS
jgi:hypothetical protein